LLDSLLQEKLKMRLSAALLVVCCCLGITLANPRARRSACDETSAKYDACVASAQAEHAAKLAEGDDGRDDFYSRKSCNFIEKAVGECGDLLIGDCYTAEAVLEMKDNQFKSIVASLEQIEEWDSSKCDSIKEWMDRMEAAAVEPAADADVDGDGVNDDSEDNDDNAANDDNNDDDENTGDNEDADKTDDTANNDENTDEDEAGQTGGDNTDATEDNADNTDDDTKTGEDGENGEDEEGSNGAGHIASLPLLTLAVLLFK